MPQRNSMRWPVAAILSATPLLSQAAEIDGATLSVWWGLPFIVLLTAAKNIAARGHARLAGGIPVL
ncbi:hypothetical protein [uncultured Sphaerotilus sp.]|uniref:hypothetical protein n=1 Tax=uncultured Sphaerotilus sp. TaxID=474984 RepID=UPI0030CA32A6